MNVTVDKALLEQAMRAIFPVMEYGLPGTKDTQQHALQKVYAGLTAALVEPAVEPVAWMTFDGEGGYDLRLYDMNESYRDDYIKRNGEKYASWVQPLYASPPPPADVQLLTQDDIVQIILSSKHLPLGEAIRLTEKVVRQKAGL